MKYINRILGIVGMSFTIICMSGCVANILDQEPTTELGNETYWSSTDDAQTAIIGVYNKIRTIFDKDFAFDNKGEFVSGSPSAACYGDNFQQLYGGVNSANYVIENLTKMIDRSPASSRATLESILGEARLLRGLCYFRLITLWGDVPYFDRTITQKEAEVLSRTSITTVKDSIDSDFTYAINKLPNKVSDVGRVAKPAAYAFRGKLRLYWASWKHYGWPECDDFEADENEALNYYKSAAEDFKHVVNDFGLTLFRNGEPGENDGLGKADNLPNYYWLFNGKYANGDPEMLMVLTHGGYLTDGCSEEFQRDFGGRFQSNSQNKITPRFEIADRYQSTITGDFCPKLIGGQRGQINSVTGQKNEESENSAINPQSYDNRDWRMKATIIWDGEMSAETRDFVPEGTTNIMHPFIYRTWAGKWTIDGTQYVTYRGSTNSGYVFRKYTRNYEGVTLHRSYGDYNFPLMRLADVYLMYAEASNEAYGPQQDAIDLVNKIRHRGNLPPLAEDKVSNKSAFFDAIEQERIIELYAEGQRYFDIKRWHALERIYGAPFGDGIEQHDTWGNLLGTPYRNATDLAYKRYYINAIPQSEINKNPNLTQNSVWFQ